MQAHTLGPGIEPTSSQVLAVSPKVTETAHFK